MIEALHREGFFVMKKNDVRTEREFAQKTQFEKVKKILLDLEFQILVFPVVVVVIVATTFLFPEGKCCVWQWWVAATVTVVACFLRARSWRRGVIDCAVFLIVLCGLWVLCNGTITRSDTDNLQYHQPAIRMIIEGWNPIWEGTFAKMQQSVNVSPSFMNGYHVIAMPKGVWYFCSSAFTFTRAASNLLLPLFPILFLCVVYLIFSVFRHVPIMMRLGAVLIVFHFTPTHSNIVDAVAALAGIGLLLQMYDYFINDRYNLLRLTVFSFWMAIAKQPSMLQCCVFWMIFVGGVVIKNRYELKKIFPAAVVLLVLSCVVNVSPYVTSYVNFGHPLYPQHSGDVKTFPPKNITADFLNRNEDAAYMGRLGCFVNSFISSTVALAYYKLKTGNRNFLPKSEVWMKISDGNWNTGTPTSVWFKIVFCTTILVLLLFGGFGSRFVVICAVVSALFLPTEMIGYLRYTPWILCVSIFLLPVVMKALKGEVVQLLASCISVLAIVVVLAAHLVPLAISIDNAYAMRRFVRSSPPLLVAMSPTTSRHANRRFVDIDSTLANLLLFKRQNPELKETRIYTCPSEAKIVADAESWQDLYDYSCKVPPVCDLTKDSAYLRIVKTPDRMARLFAWPFFILRSLFVTFPQNALEVLHGW